MSTNTITRTETLGGGGGKPFNPMSIKTIAIRHGSKVDAIIINGIRYGGAGGNQSATLTLATDEFINKMVVWHGEVIDYLIISTNKGRSIGGGGSGGRETILEGNILKIGGRSGAMLDQLEIIGQIPSQTRNFGGKGGNHFSPLPIATIAIRHGNRVDAIIINGVRYGGTGGSQSGTLTFAADEFINKMVVRHGDAIDYLTIYTNKGRSIGGGGGGGGTATTIEGTIVQIGGRSGSSLDALEIIGKLMPSFEEINSKPSMDLVGSLQFNGRRRLISFVKNGYPLDYHSLAGVRWQHLQDMIRLPDANGRQYYMGTFSQNCSNSEGGMVFVGEVITGDSGKVIWMDELNNSHLAGGYNHPGDLRRVGNIVIIAGQNWEGSDLADLAVSLGGDAMHRGQGNFQNILFYDVSNPAKPRYIGKLNSCWDGNVRKMPSGEIDILSAAKSGDYYYLSFNDIKCRSKFFYPHAEWEFIEGGNEGTSSPVFYRFNNSEYVGGATFSDRINYDRLRFFSGTNVEATLTQQTNKVLREPVTSTEIIKPTYTNGATVSVNSFGGKSYIVITNVESDSRIEIEEIEGSDT